MPLAELLAELRSELALVAQSRTLDLQIDAIDVVLSTDRILLRQLLENLLSNAIKYTDRGHVLLRCSLNADALLIDITDTGIGIPSEKIERIFDEYYQVDVHGARRAGVGLGLAIVREVARVLGYSIKVSSEVGVGTHVQIRVPRKTLVDHPLVVEQTMTSAELSPMSRHRPRLILVEDNDGVRHATELFLTLEGFEIQSGTSAAEADCLLSQAQGDQILIVDFHLDGANTGLDVVQHARDRSNKAIPAIIISGDLPSVLRSIKEPINHCRFLSKPVDTRELLEAICELS